jgi:hypothetical protein
MKLFPWGAWKNDETALLSLPNFSSNWGHIYEFYSDV